jgi:hypothetical protein
LPYPSPYFATSFILSRRVHGIQTENFLLDHCAITCQSDTGDRAHLQGICKSIRDLEAWLCIWDLSVYVCRCAARRRAPYPVRTAFQRCLGDSTDSVLVRQVEAYVAAHPGGSNGPMTAVVVRALFDLCRTEISKIKPPTHQCHRSAAANISPVQALDELRRAVNLLQPAMPGSETVQPVPRSRTVIRVHLPARRKLMRQLGAPLTRQRSGRSARRHAGRAELAARKSALDR